ncbi:DUF5683 domain-containing protein [Formosa sp. A9]|uniref:DUF5683 domain-containing protein n=1 Tax=Formosa sp. A9 TaxID=3442641 RepID=UPI003EB8F6D3
MQSKCIIALLLSLFFCLHSLAQETDKERTETTVKSTDTLKVEQSTDKKAKIESQYIDPLAPARAAFYSAVLPGLGQAYNKKYWKIPIVYAALGTGIYFYIDNNNAYNRYRDAYKRRLAGFEDDEFYGRLSTDGLINAQEQLRRNKEMSLLITVGLYALQIIDANVDAHLMQFNIDDNLSLAPHYEYNEFENTSNLGLTFNFKF